MATPSSPSSSFRAWRGASRRSATTRAGGTSARSSASIIHGLDGGKDKYYALYALTQCLSSAAMWAEPYLCDSLLVKYGGHVVFDYSIPLAFIVYLAAASRMEPRKAKAA